MPSDLAIAHKAMNSRVEPEIICAPLSETHQQNRTGIIVDFVVAGSGLG